MRHAHFFVSQLLLVLFTALRSHAAVVQDLWGADRSELLYASSGGGTHIYFSGSNIGSAFAPPTVLIGHRGEIECRVQPCAGMEYPLS